jgi:bacteriorhodopsin
MSKTIDFVDTTARWSIYAQIVLGLFSFVGFAGISNEEDVLVALLVSDLIVQAIEFVFYLVFVRLDAKVTAYRYIDWYISTPIMLLSTAILLEFFATENTTNVVSLPSFFSTYANEAIYIVGMNTIMLTCGLTAELLGDTDNKGLSYTLLTLGNLAFVATFILIFVEFGAKTIEGIVLLSVMCFIWSLYGLAAHFSYVPKNVMYNVLDIFSKNFYGTFIAIYLLAK